MAPTAPPLTREEFVSLRDGAKGLMHRIPSEHKARLIELGYIEEVLGGIRLTSAAAWCRLMLWLEQRFSAVAKYSLRPASIVLVKEDCRVIPNHHHRAKDLSTASRYRL
jgi:hypothetical protein